MHRAVLVGQMLLPTFDKPKVGRPDPAGRDERSYSVDESSLVLGPGGFCFLFDKTKRKSAGRGATFAYLPLAQT